MREVQERLLPEGLGESTPKIEGRGVDGES